MILLIVAGDETNPLQNALKLSGKMVALDCFFGVRANELFGTVGELQIEVTSCSLVELLKPPPA